MNAHKMTAIGQPIAQPLSLAELKAYLKISNAQEDELLIYIISATSSIFEKYTGLAIARQRWKLVYEDFESGILTMPIKPLIEIESIEVLNCNKQKSLSKNKYQFDQYEGEIIFNEYITAEKLQIIFCSGYPDSISVPYDIKSALLMHAAYEYENRGQGAPFSISFYNQFRSARL
jgi:uncharacterized phiE125 gp8 family phage protein